MVNNETLLSKITKIIATDGEIKPMLSWSKRFETSKKVMLMDEVGILLIIDFASSLLIREMRRILLLISGGDVVEMLKG